jgi:hypothetical protein
VQALASRLFRASAANVSRGSYPVPSLSHSACRDHLNEPTLAAAHRAGNKGRVAQFRRPPQASRQSCEPRSIFLFQDGLHGTFFFLIFGRPSCLPSALAFGNPARTRSWIIARSNSATRPTSGTWPSPRGLSCRDTADAGTGLCRAHATPIQIRPSPGGFGRGDRRTRP